MEKFKKVIAIQSVKNGIIKLYGKGKLVPNQVPNEEPFASSNIKNPCILLKSGEYVWGYQCWWGEKKAVEKKLGKKNIKKADIVPTPNIQPLK